MKTIDISVAGNNYTFKYNDEELYYKSEIANDFVPFQEITLDNGMWLDEDIVRKTISWKYQ